MPEQQKQSPPPIPPGAVVQYYNDLAGGVLAPEDMRVESLQFRAQISPTGQVLFSTPAITVISRYQFALRRIIGWAMDPDLAGAAPALVNVNVKEQGRGFSIFKSSISMQSLLAPEGAGNVHRWDGVYVCIPGTDLEVEWSVDIARWPALVGAAREFGVQLLGDYVACAP